jgi:hypothetical protein
MSIATILTAIETALTGITTGTPPARVIPTISKDFDFAEGTQYPAVMLTVPDTMLDDRAAMSGTAIERIMLYAVVKSESAPMAAMLALRAAITKALFADRSLGGVCHALRVVRARVAEELFPDSVLKGFRPPYAGYCIEIDATYSYNQSNGV